MSGKDRVKFLESICVADLEGMPAGQSKLSVYTNEKGGIIDDTVITKVSLHRAATVVCSAVATASAAYSSNVVSQSVQLLAAVTKHVT